MPGIQPKHCVRKSIRNTLIPRLTDDENGYGPNGKNFIAHVDIPETVKIAFEELKFVYGDKTREANPLYSSK